MTGVVQPHAGDAKSDRWLRHRKPSPRRYIDYMANLHSQRRNHRSVSLTGLSSLRCYSGELQYASRRIQVRDLTRRSTVNLQDSTRIENAGTFKNQDNNGG